MRNDDGGGGETVFEAKECTIQRENKHVLMGAQIKTDGNKLGALHTER